MSVGRLEVIREPDPRSRFPYLQNFPLDKLTNILTTLNSEIRLQAAVQRKKNAYET